MNRPISISIIAVIFIVAGTLSGIEIIYDLYHGSLNLNFAVLMLPVGIGLLKGKAASRTWAKVWIGLIIGIVGLLLLFYPFYGDQFSVNWYSEQLQGVARHLAVTGLSLLFIVPGIVIWRFLTSSNADLFFEGGNELNKESDHNSE